MNKKTVIRESVESVMDLSEEFRQRVADLNDSVQCNAHEISELRYLIKGLNIQISYLYRFLGWIGDEPCKLRFIKHRKWKENIPKLFASKD